LVLSNIIGEASLSNESANLTLVDDDKRANAIDAGFRFVSTNLTSVNDLLLTPDKKIWFASETRKPYGVANGVIGQDGSDAAIVYNGLSDGFNSLALSAEQSVVRGGAERNYGPVQYGPDVY